ncbi:MAG: hypothetical protein H6573_07440 [Lewinellaceae bacterium]|nr:hypothetical protein [Lewinellaceae bacterium]
MKKKTYQLTTPWGFQYSFTAMSIEEATILIEKYNGVELKEWTKVKTHGNIYKLDTGQVVSTSYVDATVYSSFEGFLANLQTSGMHIRKHIPTTYPIQHIRYGLKEQKVICYQIDRQELEILLNTANPIANSKPLVFLTNEGEVITEYGFLYQEREGYEIIKTFDDFLRKVTKENWSSKKRSQMAPELKGRNPFGKEFLNHIHELIDHLPLILACPTKLLTYKENSIDKLEKYLYRNLITADFADKTFLPLLAYIGEVGVRQLEGQWVMRYDEIFNHWYPDVKKRDGGFKDMYRPLMQILDHTQDQYYPLRTVLFSKGNSS